MLVSLVSALPVSVLALIPTLGQCIRRIWSTFRVLNCSDTEIHTSTPDNPQILRRLMRPPTCLLTNDAGVSTLWLRDYSSEGDLRLLSAGDPLLLSQLSQDLMSHLTLIIGNDPPDTEFCKVVVPVTKIDERLHSKATSIGLGLELLPRFPTWRDPWRGPGDKPAPNIGLGLASPPPPRSGLQRWFLCCLFWRFRALSIGSW